MQDDRLQPYLTVSESMVIASKLKNNIMELDIYHKILVKISFSLYLYI